MMVLLIVMASLLVSPFTAYLYSGVYQYAPGVYLHGLAAVIGVGYGGFLSIVVSKKDFGKNFRRFDWAAALLMVGLLAAVIAQSVPMVNFFAVCHIVLLLCIFIFRQGGREAASIFIRVSLIIACIAWTYFLYSMHMDRFMGFKTEFSYSLLALSFPLSLAIFSRLWQFLAEMKQLKAILGVLVGGVLFMFAGMVMEYPFMEAFFAVILIVWIVYIICKAVSGKKFPLVAVLTGLLMTGVIGGVYLVISLHVYDKAPLLVHTHAAYILWAVGAYYIIFFHIETFDRLTVATFLVPICLSFVLLGIYFLISPGIWVLHMAAVLFFAAALGFAVRALCQRKEHERENI